MTPSLIQVFLTKKLLCKFCKWITFPRITKCICSYNPWKTEFRCFALPNLKEKKRFCSFSIKMTLRLKLSKFGRRVDFFFHNLKPFTSWNRYTKSLGVEKLIFFFKRVAGILYFCYRTRVAKEFDFEFGFKKTNPHQKIISEWRSDRSIYRLTSRSYFSKEGNPQWKIFTTPDFFGA